MKSFLVLFLIFSAQAHAALTCDLNVKVPRYENVKTQKVTIEKQQTIGAGESASYVFQGII